MRELNMQEVDQVGGGVWQALKYVAAGLSGAAMSRYVYDPVLDGAEAAMRQESSQHNGPIDRMGHSGAF